MKRITTHSEWKNLSVELPLFVLLCVGISAAVIVPVMAHFDSEWVLAGAVLLAVISGIVARFWIGLHYAVTTAENNDGSEAFAAANRRVRDMYVKRSGEK